MDETDIVITEGDSVLDADTIPNANQSTTCFSCEAQMTGVYCIACGQKNDNYRRSIFSLFAELAGSFTALEARIWRTWGALLFKPGKVAREYADGARVKWSTPIRVFLAISIFLFGFLSLSQTQLISVDMNVSPKKGVTKPYDQLIGTDLRLSSQVSFFVRQSRIDERNEDRDFDLIDKWLGESGFQFELNSGGEVDDVVLPYADTPKPPELLQAYSFFDSPQNRQLIIQLVKDPSRLNSIVYTWLPRIMFLMMPFTMLIGAMFVRGRKNALLYDHLVHAAYIHSVGFFLLFLGVIMMNFVPGGLMAKLLAVFMLIYLPLSLRRMFGRGWIKTIWASYGVGLLYSLVLIIVLSAVIVYNIQKSAIQIG